MVGSERRSRDWGQGASVWFGDSKEGRVEKRDATVEFVLGDPLLVDGVPSALEQLWGCGPAWLWYGRGFSHGGARSEAEDCGLGSRWG